METYRGPAPYGKFFTPLRLSSSTPASMRHSIRRPLRLCLDWWYKVEWNRRKWNFNKFHCLNTQNWMGWKGERMESISSNNNLFFYFSSPQIGRNGVELKSTWCAGLSSSRWPRVGLMVPPCFNKANSYWFRHVDVACIQK